MPRLFIKSAQVKLWSLSLRPLATGIQTHRFFTFSRQSGREIPDCGNAWAVQHIVHYVAAAALGTFLAMLTSPRERQNALYQLNAAVIAGAVYVARVKRPGAASLVRFCVPLKLFRD